MLGRDGALYPLTSHMTVTSMTSAEFTKKTWS
jgi:hypothetical protein